MGLFNRVAGKTSYSGLELIIGGGIAGGAAGSYMDNSTAARGLTGGLLIGSSAAATRSLYRGYGNSAQKALLVADSVGSAYFGAKIFDKR